MKQLAYPDMSLSPHGENEEEKLMSLADNMAAAASMFNAHGYDNFIHSRQAFRKTLHDHFLKFVKITHPEV